VDATNVWLAPQGKTGRFKPLLPDDGGDNNGGAVDEGDVDGRNGDSVRGKLGKKQVCHLLAFVQRATLRRANGGRETVQIHVPSQVLPKERAVIVCTSFTCLLPLTSHCYRY